MRIEWITGPRETRFGELKPGEFYELPDEEAGKLIASGLAKRADMRTYPERAARRRAEHDTGAPATGGND